VRYELHRYDARHAFANETAVNAKIPIEYHAGAAELAWRRSFDFLKRELA
jgi:carboxymethylenebutenolidase